jgi:hypothetical protein
VTAVRGAASPSAWTWGRLLRVSLVGFGLLALLDFTLAGEEQRIARESRAGLVRNADGRNMMDSCLRALREGGGPGGSETVVMVGASVTFGSNLRPLEALPAQLSARLAEHDPSRSAANCAIPGGGTRSPLPVTAAFSRKPAALLLIEVMVPVFAAREMAPVPPWSEQEVALLQLASPAQRAWLEQSGNWPDLRDRVEAQLSERVRAHWRLYRLRGPLWIDDELMPNQLVWTLRRELAAAGLLPKRFHGQTTNVGKVPWRQAYTGGQRPAGSQRFNVPVEALSERDVSSLLLVARSSAEAGVPVALYEIPLNLPFQREFGLMSEEELARLARVRELLRQRIAPEGLPWIDAPVLPDEAFLDRAHLTPSGSRLLAAYLAPTVEEILARTQGGATRTDTAVP